MLGTLLVSHTQVFSKTFDGTGHTKVTKNDVVMINSSSSVFDIHKTGPIKPFLQGSQATICLK